ncbi:phosphoribosylglycinamide formyltransferase [Cetobacterium sp. SF1]|uniref:phosphoribosylglycinamide formyltransferase n=1 Tax=Cetobacterium sp. SF1 TaxID=3417654 RepID=UPI003CEEAE6A
MVKVAVLASGSGSNFEKIVLGEENYKVELLIVDREKAYALERGKNLGVQGIYVNPKSFSSKGKYEEKIIELLEEREIEWIFLAGYMRIISKTLLEKYPERIVNIHPSYLPKFPGKRAIEDAYENKVSETGVTIHYVDEGVDTGKIIAQEKIKIDSGWTLDNLQEEVHRVEHRLYPQIIKKLVEENKK